MKNPSIFTQEGYFKTNSLVHVSLVSATLSAQIEALSEQLMSDETRVGLEEAPTEKALDNVIPDSIDQRWMVVPLQFKILYLLAFLYLK